MTLSIIIYAGGMLNSLAQAGKKMRNMLKASRQYVGYDADVEESAHQKPSPSYSHSSSTATADSLADGDAPLGQDVPPILQSKQTDNNTRPIYMRMGSYGLSKAGGDKQKGSNMSGCYDDAENDVSSVDGFYATDTNARPIYMRMGTYGLSEAEGDKQTRSSKYSMSGCYNDPEAGISNLDGLHAVEHNYAKSTSNLPRAVNNDSGSPECELDLDALNLLSDNCQSLVADTMWNKGSVQFQSPIRQGLLPLLGAEGSGELPLLGAEGSGELPLLGAEGSGELPLLSSGSSEEILLLDSGNSGEVLLLGGGGDSGEVPLLCSNGGSGEVLLLGGTSSSGDNNTQNLVDILDNIAAYSDETNGNKVSTMINGVTNVNQHNAHMSHSGSSLPSLATPPNPGSVSAEENCKLTNHAMPYAHLGAVSVSSIPLVDHFLPLKQKKSQRKPVTHLPEDLWSLFPVPFQSKQNVHLEEKKTGGKSGMTPTENLPQPMPFSPEIMCACGPYTFCCPYCLPLEQQTTHEADFNRAKDKTPTEYSSKQLKHLSMVTGAYINLKLL